MIRMNDFKADPAQLLQQELAAAERVLQSGWFVLGKEVEQFEAAWARYCKARFAVGVGNGMDAIEAGLRAINIGPGDEVITTPMTAMATVLGIIRSGATPVLADIEPETALLDLESVKRCVSPRTRGVLLVHLYGQIKQMDRWSDFCQSRGLHLLEDCCQSHGAEWNGQRAGTFGTWGAYSFYPTKNLGARGDGGALITNLSPVATKAKMLRNYGQSQRYHHPEIGLNSRLDEVQAAMLSARLTWLDGVNARRRENALSYHNSISNSRVQLLAMSPSAENHVHHLFVVRCRERDRLAEHLKSKEIETLVHYPVPVHQQSSCADIARDPRGLPQAEIHARECLSLPCHPNLRDDEVARVIEAVNAFR